MKQYKNSKEIDFKPLSLKEMSGWTDIRALKKYADDKNVSISDLSYEEKALFDHPYETKKVSLK